MHFTAAAAAIVVSRAAVVGEELGRPPAGRHTKGVDPRRHRMHTGSNGPTSDPGSTDLPVQSFLAADASTQTIPLLPSWSAITVSEGASLSSTMVPPAATAAAIRCSATSDAT